MEVIQTRQLTKRFGNVTALDDISVHVHEGEIYGFLGLNGAGKTTLIRTLLGMIRPDEGQVALFGRPVRQDFDRWNDIGYLVETPQAYPNLTVAENLRICHKLRRLKDPAAIDHIIDHLQLARYRNTRAGTLSLGNRQRLGIAKALMHRPRLLILDEPVNGLDPEGIVEVRHLLKTLVQNGSTVFLSSHILGEIAKVATRIGIIHEGRLVQELTTAALSEQIIRQLWIRTNDDNQAIQVLRDAGYTAIMTPTGDIGVGDAHALDHPERISQLLTDAGLPPRQLYLFTEDLEMFFLRTIKATHP